MCQQGILYSLLNCRTVQHCKVLRLSVNAVTQCSCKTPYMIFFFLTFSHSSRYTAMFLCDGKPEQEEAGYQLLNVQECVCTCPSTCASLPQILKLFWKFSAKFTGGRELQKLYTGIYRHTHFQTELLNRKLKKKYCCCSQFSLPLALQSPCVQRMVL